jgi:curved DNA-binding protein
MEYKDYYKTLGVEKNADAAAIKKQYRLLARKYHPDVSTEKNAEEKFKEVQEAYEVLKDPKKRQAYDQMGSEWQAGQQGFKPPPGWEFHTSREGAEEQFGASDYSDFFESLFGQRTRGGRQRAYSQRGQDQHSKVNIFLEDAYKGAEQVLQLQESELDRATGEVQYKTRSLKVKIPAGVTEGQQIRLAQQGSKGMGGAPNGDLYLEIKFAEHPYYIAKEKDIYLNLPVMPWEAALGAKIDIPTLGGKVAVTIPAGSQTGNKLRLKGRGLPGNPAGDEFAILTIYIPEPKTDSQRELYKKMAEEMHYNPRNELMK